VWLGGWITAGLRPEPQGACTLAAGAAHEGIGAGSRDGDRTGKGVFSRHSTQSSIAARLRGEWRQFKSLRVACRSLADKYLNTGCLRRIQRSALRSRAAHSRESP
jgi:hypothetical protein